MKNIINVHLDDESPESLATSTNSEWKQFIGHEDKRLCSSATTKELFERIAMVQHALKIILNAHLSFREKELIQGLLNITICGDPSPDLGE
ncbi:MAG: hypothetical protein RR506_07190 [Akkermansia sp.]